MQASLQDYRLPVAELHYRRIFNKRIILQPGLRIFTCKQKKILHLIMNEIFNLRIGLKIKMRQA